MCQCYNFTSRLQKMGPNSGPVFGPTFSPFLECTSLLLFYTKKRKTGTSKITISFLSTQLRLPQDAAHADNDSNKIVSTMSKTLLFPILWRAPQHLAKISTIFGPRSGLMDGTKFERQTCKSFRNLGGNCQEKSSERKLCKPVWKIRSQQQWKPRQSKGTLETDRKQQENSKNARNHPKQTHAKLANQTAKSRNGNLQNGNCQTEKTKKVCTRDRNKNP